MIRLVFSVRILKLFLPKILLNVFLQVFHLTHVPMNHIPMDGCQSHLIRGIYYTVTSIQDTKKNMVGKIIK